MTNQAWALRGGFGIDRLELEERPVRAPGFGEARVRVEWVSLNRRDLLLVEGVYNPRQVLPIVPCSDGAGTVEAIGEGCARVKAGDRVVVHFFPGWIAGEPDMAKLSTALGGPGGDGTLATDDGDFRAGAGPPARGDFDASGGDLALRRADGLVGGRRTRRRQAGIVRRHSRDRRRVAVRRPIRQDAGRARRRDDLQRREGGEAARTRRRPMSSTIAPKPIGRAARAIWPAAASTSSSRSRGADTLDASLRLVRPGGTIALVGVLSGAKASINLPLAVMRQVRLQGVTCGHRETFEAMLRAIAAHGVDPVISHRFAFPEAREALRCMAGADHVGKIVIDMAG